MYKNPVSELQPGAICMRNNNKNEISKHSSPFMCNQNETQTAIVPSLPHISKSENRTRKYLQEDVNTLSLHRIDEIRTLPIPYCA